MNSMICHAQLMHARQQPVRHLFRYPLYLYSLDLAELPAVDRRVPLFGYNRFRPASIRDRDYLSPGDQPIAEKLAQIFDEQGCREPLSRVQLVTAARYFGHVFNPVSFFFCYGEGGALRYLVTQVSNTFGEMHLYVLRDPEPATSPHEDRFQAEKVFHVSPFFPRRGRYEFLVADVRDTLDIVIHYQPSDGRAFSARLWGSLEPLTGAALARTMLRQPITPSLTPLRILRQAGSLYFGKRLPVFRRPAPEAPLTVRHAPPGLLQRAGRGLVLRMLSRVRRGHIRVGLPDGDGRVFGDPGQQPSADLQVRDHRFFGRVLFAGDIGFGESYVDRDWDSDDLPGLLSFLLRNWDHLDDRHILTAHLGRAANLLRHLPRHNSLRNSRSNIGAHYDLNNNFYRLFLDPSLTYSCAWYADEQATLEQAQRHKIRRLLEKARVRPGDHLLEIGCGWGSCALMAAQEFDCRVTGITLSEEQLGLARERVWEAGLEGRVDMQLVDYRNMDGQFDRIVSIEMLEAVGHRYFKRYFATLERLLKPDGLVGLQVITIPDDRYPHYRRSSDWIRKHIFPGGHLPSLAALTAAMATSSRLVVEELENIGVHYARTLREWRLALAARREDALALGFDDRFLRTWDYYFSYCEAGFGTRMLNTLQLILTRPGNPELPSAPFPEAGT